MGDALIVFSFFAFLAFLIWNRTRARFERQRLQLDAQAQILDKIGSGQALTDFLKTEEGKRVLDRLTAPMSEPSRNKDTQGRILVLTTLGLVALFAGFFFIMSASIPRTVTEGSAVSETAFVAFLPVFLLMGAGVGALVAAWTVYRLSRRWGILKAESPDETAD